MEWMIKGAIIMTCDDNNSWLESDDLVVDGEKIIAIGNNLLSESFEGKKLLRAVTG